MYLNKHPTTSSAQDVRTCKRTVEDQQRLPPTDVSNKNQQFMGTQSFPLVNRRPGLFSTKTTNDESNADKGLDVFLVSETLQYFHSIPALQRKVFCPIRRDGMSL